MKRADRSTPFMPDPGWPTYLPPAGVVRMPGRVIVGAGGIRSLDSVADSLREPVTALGITVYGRFSLAGILASHPSAQDAEQWGTLYVVWVCTWNELPPSTPTCPRRACRPESPRLIPCAVENVENIGPSARDAIVDEVFSRRKALHSGSDILGRLPASGCSPSSQKRSPMRSIRRSVVSELARLAQ
jgi:hypothetical protein